MHWSQKRKVTWARKITIEYGIQGIDDAMAIFFAFKATV